MDFYESLAQDYDRMTRFNDRLNSEKATLKRWLERYPFQSVVDVACGTGLHAILLAQMKIQVVGVDISRAMVAKAKENANSAGVHVTWIQASMQQLTDHINGKYDAILCLGNSLPHLVTQEHLHQAIQNFNAILKPGGYLVIQMLNYDRVMTTKERIVGIHRDGDREFIRFYDFFPGHIQFNVLTINWQGHQNIYSFTSTRLCPYRKNEIESVLIKYKFTNHEYFGDMNFTPFHHGNSRNLVVLGRKGCDSML